MTPSRSMNRKWVAAAVAALLSPALPAADWTWTSGSYPANYPNPLLAGDRLLAQGDGDKNFSAIAFTNQGTVAWQTLARIGFVSASVTNSALWDLQADASLRYAGGGASNFFNDGIFRKSAGNGTSAIGQGVQFFNAGTVDAQTGTIDFAGGSAVFNAGTQFIGAGVNRISGGASFARGFTSANLELADGNFTGDGTTPAVLGGSVRWTGGQFGGTWQIGSGQTLTARNGTHKNFDAANVTNTGIVGWESSERIGFLSTSLVNQGLWDMRTDTGLVYAGGGGSNVINQGVFRKSAGSLSTVIGQGINFFNTGTVEAQVGTIDFAGGSASFAAGTQFTGAGINRISNNASFSGAITSANLEFAAGAFAGDNTTPAELGGSARWTGGQFVGNWVVGNGQTLVVQDGGNKNFNATVFNNLGTVAWQSAERAGFISASVANNGLWDLQADANLVYAGGGGSNFANHGVFRKSAGSGSAVIGQSITFVNTGTVDAQNGTIDFAGGSAAFHAGTQFVGAGVNRISGNASFSGAFTSANLELASGQFAGANTTPAALRGHARWTGGQFTGSWQVDGQQTLAALDGGDKNFVATSFTNRGTVAWQSGQRIGFVSAVIANEALWDLQADANLTYAGGGTSNFINTGTFRKSAGDGTSAIGQSLVFINSGTIDAQRGTIDFAGGGASFYAGTQFVGAGINRISGGASFVGRFTSENLELAGGSFAGDNTTPAVLAGRATWRGGQFAGTWQIDSGQTLTAETGGDKNFVATSFTNHGSLVWHTDERVGFVSASFVNAGLFDLQTDADLAYAGGGSSNFINQGILRKSAGNDSSQFSANISFSNPGTIEALSGTLHLPDNLVNPGTLRGTATVQTSLLTNAGLVAPGAAAGVSGGAAPATLTIDGSFAQTAAGLLDIDLYAIGLVDLLQITGTASLDGGLALRCFADCSFAVGDQMLVVDATGALVGSFTGAPTLSGFASGAFEIVYDRPNGDVWLRVTQTVTAVPEPGAWLLMLGGLGLLGGAARWPRRREGSPGPTC